MITHKEIESYAREALSELGPPFEYWMLASARLIEQPNTQACCWLFDENGMIHTFCIDIPLDLPPHNTWLKEAIIKKLQTIQRDIDDAIHNMSSDELRALVRKIWKESSTALNGNKICQILVSLEQGGILEDLNYESKWCGWFRREDGSPIDWPERRLVRGLELTGYIAATEVPSKYGGVVTRYELTDKARKFLRLRESRTPHASEQFWTIIHKRDDSSEAYLFLGFGAPNPIDVIGDRWVEGDTCQVNGPFENRIRLKHLLLNTHMLP